MSTLHEAARRVVSAWASKEWNWVMECNAAVLALDAALKAQPESAQEQAGCETEADCTSQPWCRIRGACQRKQPEPAQEPVAWATEIIDALQAQYDTEMIKENDSGDALIRLDDVIAAVEDAEKHHTTPPKPEPAQAAAVEPSSDQLQAIWDGLARCHVKASAIEFLRAWIRDWTAHKNGALAQAMLDAAAVGTGITLAGKRINPASIYKQARCETEADCTSQPWCRISGECHRKQEQPEPAQEPITRIFGTLPVHDAQQPEPAQEAEPYAWHYTNNAGASVWHRGPSTRLDADMQAARDYPRVHKVTPLYTGPLQRPPLTDEEISDIYIDWDITPGRRIADLVRAIERKVRGEA